jgi:hypothetical protein
MVYAVAARKTISFMVIAMVISLAVVMMLSGDLSTPTGRVTDTTISAPEGSSWMIFLLGLFVGALVVGAYFYLAGREAKRKE